MRRAMLYLAVAAACWGQTPPAPTPPAAAAPKPPAKKAATPTGVDMVIDLVKKNMSEALIIKTLQREGKAYSLTTSDLVKLQGGGVSERIIEVMMDPKSAVAAAPAGTAPAAVTPAPTTKAAAPAATAAADGPATPFPADLASAPKTRKRRLAVKPFDYSAVKTWVTYWFNNDVNIGQGIRAMLSTRMNASKTITVLERMNLEDLMKEQDLGNSGRVRQGTKAKVGNISGADCILYGDIVIFGRDDTTKRTGFAAAISKVAGGGVGLSKEEKAVVAINLRIVDAETGEVLETAEARGESSRKSRDYSGFLGGKGGAAAGASGMNASNFAETIIGEATSNAVDKVVAFLEGKVPAIPAKARSIEGRVANITANGVYLTVGDSDGVLLGDRFEILKITGEVIDPATKQVIDVEATKIGELVVNNVRDKAAIGVYGGVPLSPQYAALAGKGYAARLMSQ